MCAYLDQRKTSLHVPNCTKVWRVATRCSARYSSLLLKEHTISVGVEPVSCLDRVPVSGHYELFAAQRAHQHQQGGLRQMKVCQQRVYDAKTIAWIDKRVRLAAPGFYAICACALAGILCSALRGNLCGVL